MAAILSGDVVKKGRVKVVKNLSSESNVDEIQNISDKAESWHYFKSRKHKVMNMYLIEDLGFDSPDD